MSRGEKELPRAGGGIRQEGDPSNGEHYDVVILGGGLAGQSLAQHLLRETEKSVLLLERQRRLPPERQKVGESLVQLAGYYFSKVLDLEAYLLHHQHMKYNLRFYWRSGGRDNARFEDFAHSYIRSFSNIASYQLDRNTFEAELLRRNLEDPRFELRLGVQRLEVELGEGEAHRIHTVERGERRTVAARWVVDATGRNRLLAKRLELTRRNDIRHGAFFWWVEGTVDLDKLTDRTPREVRLRPELAHVGHLPLWLATNHFCGEGYWFWVIPLQGKTSLGLVFDNRLIDPGEVFSVEKATEWVCRELPLFASDLPHRKVLDFGGYRDFSHDCAQTLSPHRWAMAGEAGRFTDPLYSPGSDLIAIYNTLIVDAVETEGDAELAAKCQLYEQLMRAVYQAYVPSYARSYDVLGDQEAFSLKYTWELAIYFAFYVFPFINDLFTERRFILGFLRSFSKLGPLNRDLQAFLSDYYQWKKEARQPPAEPLYFDLMSLAPLRTAESTFYQVGVSVDQAKRVLGEQLASLEELARLIFAHAASVVVEDPRLLTNRRFIEGIDLGALRFAPEEIRRRWRASAGSRQRYRWSLDPSVLAAFRTPARTAELVS